MGFENIKQARVPMEQVMAGVPNNTHLTYNAWLTKVLHRFIQENQENYAVHSPFNGGNYDKYDLYRAKDEFIGLSHWDEVSGKFGFSMDRAVSKLDTYSANSYERNMLFLGSKVYDCMQKGISDRNIEYLIENSAMPDKSRLDEMHMDSLIKEFENLSDEQVRFIEKVANPESRYIVDFHWDRYGFDEHVIEAIGICENDMVAEYLESYMHEGTLTAQEAKTLAEANNLLPDHLSTTDRLEFLTHAVERSWEDRMDTLDADLENKEVDTTHVSLTDNTMLHCAQAYCEQSEQSDIDMSAFVDDYLTQRRESTETTIEDVLQSTGKALSMDPIDSQFKSGSTQIDICGNVIESGYEYFTPAISIYENGRLLYKEDATCVDNYHNETYTRGKFTSRDDVYDYLRDKYSDVKDWEQVPEPCQQLDIVSYPIVWSNLAYAKERERQANPEPYLDRIVFKDFGVEKMKNGKSYHRVDFARACDQMTFGQDESIPNPYLVSSKRKVNGELKTIHSYFLSDAIHQRLLHYANIDGMEQSQWSGIIAAEITYPTERNSKAKLSVNLTDEATKKGMVVKPTVSFNEAAHDSFVKQSLAEVRKKREAMRKQAFPDVAEQAANGPQFGE